MEEENIENLNKNNSSKIMFNETSPSRNNTRSKFNFVNFEDPEKMKIN
jgi:hypothetical protein